MQATYNNIKEELAKNISEEKAVTLPRFFKTGKGQYGEGDIFIGVTVPLIRKVAKMFPDTEFDVLKELVKSPVHEERLVGLLILLNRFEKTKDNTLKEQCVNFYLSSIEGINNWDLVDLTCYKLLGKWLHDKDKTILYEMAKTDHLWTQRIGMVSCMYFIRKGEFEDTFAIADILINHKHDLIHKAVGWLLREIGKKDRNALTEYLIPRYKKMPRTMLRYAIEHFEEDKRKAFLNSQIEKNSTKI